MKISSRKSKILIALLVILFVLSLNFYQKEVKNLFYLISLPIQKFFWQTGDSTSDFFEAISKSKNLEKENEELKLKIQELLSENSSLKEAKKENEFLREALNLGLEKEFQLKIARVIGKDISQDSLMINKGSREGILKDMPVITKEKNLVGKIDEVYNDFSKILLISNKKSSFDAEVQERNVEGVIKGRGSGQLFFDLVPREKEIQTNDNVITSALGGIFPPGLLVGQIKEIKKSDIEPFQTAEINPAFDIKELKDLFIIADF
jgi:rod shape-determining protein MreC